MKLFAQHGHAPADKIDRAVKEKIVDGVILSPRYLSPDSINQLVKGLRSVDNEIEILIDPEFYATKYIGTPNAQLRYLEDWPYFVPYKINELLVGTTRIDKILRTVYEVQMTYRCNRLISPNIYITNSFDSIEAAIAISFFNRSKPIAIEMGIEVPVYATLAFGRDAIVDHHNYMTFLNAITAIDTSPEGIYVLVGAGSTDERVGTVRSEILTADVIAGWMLLNYSLSLNRLEVINGYSDILTPLLGLAGGHAGATGWWSNLQVFSMGRYIRSSSGGQLPLVRYLSKRLLNRINVNEREAFAEVMPEIMNNLSADQWYLGRQPSRTEEAIQTWQAMASLNEDIILNDINESLAQLQNLISEAEDSYNELQTLGLTQRYEANLEYISALKDSLRLFEQMAEL